MRFDGPLESAYRRDQFQDRLRYLRINLAILAAISLTVIQIDRVVVPVIGRIVPDLARTGVMLPLLLLGFAITFIRRADVWYPRYIAVAMIVALAGMSWISLTAWGEGEPRVFVRLMLAIVAVYFVLGLAFRSAIAVNVIGLAVYAALAVSKGMPGVEMTHYLATLVTANIICIAGAYNLEHARRIAWLEGQRLAESALQDGLTGIHNRRRFDEHLQRVWRSAVRDESDRAPVRRPRPLQALQRLLRPPGRRRGLGGGTGDRGASRVRPDLAARYGGEEFMHLLFDTKREQAEQIADEILEAVRQLGIVHQDSSAAPVLTISIGIACVVPAARRSWAGLIQLADQALYAAKDGGRNRAVALEQEYEHMQTGYFHRRPAAKDEAEKPGS